jgi:arylsulfatase A-like enzyme
MAVGERIAGAARGLGGGLAAGAVWWGVEAAANWAAGGVVPAAIAGQIAAVDLGVGAAVGMLLGLVSPRAGVALRALVLAAAFGFMRVFSPPTYGTEAVFLLAAVAVVATGVRLARGAAGPLGLVHLLVVTTLAAALGELALEEAVHGTLRGVRLPVIVALLPLAGVVADRTLGLVLRAPGLRLGVEVAALALAAIVWGRPATTAPLVDPLATAVPPPPGTPDVFLVVLDTTRADHLSTYGYARETSPHLTALAADGLRFAEARSTAPWTLPGHASLFTGQFPSRHGARLAGGWLPGQDQRSRTQLAYPLARERVTMAELLRDRGYSTGAFVANFSYLYRDYGLAQGFGRYEDRPGLLLTVVPHAVRFGQQFAPNFCVKSTRSAADINAAALAWLDAAPAGRPAFAFLNYMEPHQPWAVPAPHDRWMRAIPNARRFVGGKGFEVDRHYTDAEREFMRAAYDGEIAAMDEALGALVAALKARGRYEGALIVVTSDHGEFLGEHDQAGHMARIPYEPVLRIPLVVKLPGAERPRGTIPRPVQVVDVLPTVLAAAGVAAPAHVEGHDLRAVTHAILAEEDISPFFVSRFGARYDRAARVVYDGAYKLIRTSRGERMLFDLANDPGETTNLATREPERAERLARRLQEAFGAELDVATASAR